VLVTPGDGAGAKVTGTPVYVCSPGCAAVVRLEPDVTHLPQVATGRTSPRVTRSLKVVALMVLPPDAHTPGARRATRTAALLEKPRLRLRTGQGWRHAGYGLRPGSA
jgi:hypothetical protein